MMDDAREKFMRKDQEYISSLIDDFEKFWEGWEFATQSSKPRLFDCIYEALNQYHELLLTTQPPKDTLESEREIYREALAEVRKILEMHSSTMAREACEVINKVLGE